ncbi:MAG: TonB-dependent receptor [Bacteroidota bacterium]
MKKITYLLFAILLIANNAVALNERAAKTSLSGKITDKQTGEALPGVTLYIPDLKTGAVTGIDGTYIIENLPQIKVLLQINFLGYKAIVETIDLSASNTKNFALEISIKEIHEVVITGLSQAGDKHRTPTPVSIVTSRQLLESSSSNIIDAIAKKPGISQVTTGSGISKPVIRGLGYNRVIVVNDGIRQEGQQWGDEHGIEIDEFSVNKVEILKGPASLSYGSDAMAGVINMLSAPTLPEGKIRGNLIGNYQTNNGMTGYSANLAGNKKGFIWDIRYSNKIAHAYQNKYDGYVLNSGFKENNIGGIIGLNKSWGYSHLHVSAYSMTPGIVEGDRDSATGKFIKPIAIDDTTEGSVVASNKDFKNYTAITPFQKIKHYKVALNNSFVVGNGSLKTVIGFQQNHRQEYANVLKPKEYELYFLLNTINYDLRYIFPDRNNFNISVGINGMQQTSKNKGEEFLVPEYDLMDIGAFTILRKSFEKLDISGGIRYDSRSQQSNDLFLDTTGVKTETPDSNSVHQFSSFNTTFSGVSGSIGATYQFSEELYIKLNAARGYRAPNIAELSANGVHEGTIRYEIGDAKLKAENSLQIDAAFGLNTEHVSLEIDAFRNSIDNFIFLQKLNSVNGGDSISEGLSTFKFVSGNANLMGGEITLDIHPHPLDWLHFENAFSFVQSVQTGQPDSTKYLPFTPAPKLQSELRADIKNAGKFLGNTYIKIGVDNYFVQNNFYSAYGTETKTPGYTLIDLGFGTDFISRGKTICSVFISVNNITDVAYQNHLSRLKYAPVNNATGRTGIYNMGRNISFKLIIPVDFKK